MSNTKPNQYVVAVFSMKKRFLERNPDAARLRIRVISKKSFERIQHAESNKTVLPKKYRRWVQEDPFVVCDSESDAWGVAIQIRDAMIANGRRVDLSFGPANHRLYVVEMDAKVAEQETFKKQNVMIDNLENRTCVYVGLTSQSIQERYDQHRSANHPASTQWGKKFFVEPFARGFRGDLVESFADAGFEVENLTKHMALLYEFALRCWLQSRGLAAYCN